MELPSALTERKKEVGMLIVVVIALLVLWWLGSGLVTPKDFELGFSKDSVAPGGASVLTVWVTNTLDEDVQNATVTVMPESNVITIDNPVRVEAVMGAGVRRRFDFDLGVSENATIGSYNIEILVVMNEKEVKGNAFLNVASK